MSQQGGQPDPDTAMLMAVQEMEYRVSLFNA
jgi:hypothetical protein